MGDTDATRRPPAEPAFDPAATPVPRRRVLVVLGTTAGALAFGSGLGALLAACAGPPVTVVLDFDPATLEPGTPVEVPFTVTLGSSAVEGSVWFVRKASGELVAFDPRCTHGVCFYRWSPSAARFLCGCHDGQFALDGAVLAGLPSRPLDRFPVREVGTGVEIDVPGDFQTPRESLPA
jgi:cytochrome b6-f complex iron-sulfur subunit